MSVSVCSLYVSVQDVCLSFCAGCMSLSVQVVSVYVVCLSV